MKIQDIKIRVENSRNFKLHKKELGLSFSDFDIVDLDTNIELSHGKKDIGVFTIYLQKNKIYGVVYDMVAA